MEFLLVHFPSSRHVIVDGEPNGYTNKLIELDAGTYTVSLEPPPPNFTPKSQVVVLKDTSALAPKEVTFYEV